MLEIIILVFLVVHVGNKARRKGLNVMRWRVLMIAAWVAAEFLGLMLGVMILGYNTSNLLNLMVIGLVSAIGGFLLVKYNLDKYPDLDDDINNIGNN
ncbi:MAG: hypothetical protein EOO06_15140 [Chitinophagaceae bacterium]|nr:MAG: hypothetical protein EOO06_15140 [Chitinophagaceae bacterium]